jgi:hypothetical protein
MKKSHCPGQDMQFWKPEDIFYIECPFCKTEIEFWKDEPERTCRGCKKRISNPQMDLGCTKWCKYGKECSGSE